MNQFISYEDCTISLSKSGLSYKVQMDGGATFILSKETVNHIASETEQEDYMVAVLLAYIKCARLENSKSKPPKNISEDTLFKGGKEILTSQYPIEHILALFRSLRWHEVKDVLASDDPVREMEELF